MTRLNEVIERVYKQLRGFDDIRSWLTKAAHNVNCAVVDLEAMPDDFKPKRSRSKPALEVGSLYAIKEKFAHQYEAIADGDASACQLHKIIDDKTVLVVFANETKTAVKRTHLGQKLE